MPLKTPTPYSYKILACQHIHQFIQFKYLLNLRIRLVCFLTTDKRPFIGVKSL